MLGALAVLIPALALAGYVAGGNQIVREAQDPDFIAAVEGNAHQTAGDGAQRWHIASVALAIYAGLVLLPFAGARHARPSSTGCVGRRS